MEFLLVVTRTVEGAAHRFSVGLICSRKVRDTLSVTRAADAGLAAGAASAAAEASSASAGNAGSKVCEKSAGSTATARRKPQLSPEQKTARDH